MNVLTPLPDKILVWNMSRGERQIGSIIISNDDRSGRGIRPRWAQVYKVGENVTCVKEGHWVLVEHGRWTRPFALVVDGMGDEPVEFFGVDPDCIILESATQPTDEYLNKE